jgi:hypothetical protein
MVIAKHRRVQGGLAIEISFKNKNLEGDICRKEIKRHLVDEGKLNI